MDNNKRAIQLVELNIMKQILPIMEKYKLHYYMLGGTLLGAIRHKGFIPWDDDMDIGMPRPDYDIFLQVAEQVLQPPFQLHTLQNKNGEYAYYYARVEDTSVMLKRTLTQKKVEIPAWVDVFPLDGVPEDQQHFENWKKKCSRYWKLLVFSQYEYYYNVNETKQKERVYAALVIAAKRAIQKTRVYKLISPEWAWHMMDQTLKSVDYYSSSRLINYCGAWGFKEMFNKTVYGEGQLYPFEDIMLTGPVDYDFVLTQMYGDYMTPPPENERVRHAVELD